MARQRTQYKLAGRYLRGNDTVCYGLITADGKEVRATEEVMAYYVGRDQVINVKAQLYKDKVLFRGIGCEIRDLPTIQLGSDGTAPVKPNKPVRPVQPKPVQPKPQATPKKVHASIQKIYNNIKNYNNSIWKRIPEYEVPSIEIKDGILVIKQNLCTIENDKKVPATYKYIVEELESIIYFRQDNYKDKFILRCRNNDRDINNMCHYIMNILGYTDVEALKSVNDFSNVGDDYTRAFEAFTGASNYFNDLMRELDHKYIDKYNIGTTVVQIVRILRYYDSLSDKVLDRPIALFRGGVKPAKDSIDKGILSYTYSFHVADSFAGKDKCIMILPFKQYNTGVWTSDIAVIPSEREITVSPYLKFTSLTTLGHYNGHELVKVNYEKSLSYKQQINLLLKSLESVENYMDVYLLSEILKQNINITIDGDEYSNFKIINNEKQIDLSHIEGYDTETSYYVVNMDDTEITCDSVDKCNKVVDYLFSKNVREPNIKKTHRISEELASKLDDTLHVVQRRNRKFY